MVRFRRMCVENYETAILCDSELSKSLQHRDHEILYSENLQNCRTQFHSLGFAQTSTPVSLSFCSHCIIYKNCNVGFRKLDSATI